MKIRSVLCVAAGCLSASAMADTISFGADVVGQPPAGWHCGTTGRGTPRWTVEVDASAPTGKVLRQSGSATFPWCVKGDASLADGWVETRFKPLSGKEDQAGGVVWRWKDGDNYYVARANALENNVSLYYTARGIRKTLKYVDAPVSAGHWHTLRVDFAGTAISVSLDGKRYIDFADDHIAGSGAVGVWTKADSVTAFSDFAYRAARP
jgi:FtsP/CotA-like multicopper oxidase with cupredoxin domain